MGDQLIAEFTSDAIPERRTDGSIVLAKHSRRKRETEASTENSYPSDGAEEDDNDLVLDIPKTARSHPSEIPVGAGSFVIGIMVVSKRNILDVRRILSQQKKIQYRHFGSFHPPGVGKGFVKR